MLTALDQIANQNHLQLVKAAIPYIRSDHQAPLSICIKFLELQNVLRFYRHSSSGVSACSLSDEPHGIVDILTDIRNYCDQGEQELLDQWIQIASAMELYSIFMQPSDETAGQPPAVSETQQERGDLL